MFLDLHGLFRRFSGVWDCFQSLKKERGSLRLVFFGPGLSAALIRAAPVNAVMLGGETKGKRNNGS